MRYALTLKRGMDEKEIDIAFVGNFHKACDSIVFFSNEYAVAKGEAG